ncbi:MAG: Sua5/YciO/YrdC/YwlC family protein [Bacteroidota bacterium]|nr:Sua5/YciO/YrdC/YwlC family protein [Bacteroidota bacterium]
MDYYSDINLEIIDNVREKIIDGAVIIYPTETVWALGCNASNSKSVSKIFQIKKRDKNKPLICLLSHFNQLKHYVDPPTQKVREKLNLNTHPTVIYPNCINELNHVSNNKNELAIRITPIKKLGLLIDAIQSPIVSTSANVSGEPFPRKFEDIDKRIIDSVDIIFNFDTKSSGNPSKIIRIDEFGALQYIR